MHTSNLRPSKKVGARSSLFQPDRLDKGRGRNRTFTYGDRWNLIRTRSFFAFHRSQFAQCGRGMSRHRSDGWYQPQVPAPQPRRASQAPSPAFFYWDQRAWLVLRQLHGNGVRKHSILSTVKDPNRASLIIILCKVRGDKRITLLCGGEKEIRSWQHSSRYNDDKLWPNAHIYYLGNFRFNCLFSFVCAGVRGIWTRLCRTQGPGSKLTAFSEGLHAAQTVLIAFSPLFDLFGLKYLTWGTMKCFIYNALPDQQTGTPRSLCWWTCYLPT